MKTHPDLILREIAGEAVIVPIGSASEYFNGIIQCTDTAAFIWKQIDTCDTLDEIIIKCMEEYDVDRETAEKDVYGFMEAIYKEGMVTEVAEFE